MYLIADSRSLTISIMRFAGSKKISGKVRERKLLKWCDIVDVTSGHFLVDQQKADWFTGQNAIFDILEPTPFKKHRHRRNVTSINPFHFYGYSNFSNSYKQITFMS